MSVAKAPGITQLTRTCGAYSWANAIVSALRPFFEAAYIASGGLGRTGSDAGDVDDRATAGRGHPGTGHGHQPERALEVDLDGLVEQGLRDALEAGRQRRDPGVVDQDVEASEPCVDLVDGRLDAVPAPDVQGERDRSDAGRLGDRLGRGLAGLEPCGSRPRRWLPPRRVRSRWRSPARGSLPSPGRPFRRAWSWPASLVRRRVGRLAVAAPARACRWCAGAPRWARRRSAGRG